MPEIKVLQGTQQIIHQIHGSYGPFFFSSFPGRSKKVQFFSGSSPRHGQFFYSLSIPGFPGFAE